MEVGDIIRIKNQAGILLITIKKCLKVEDVNKGNIEEMVFNGEMRLEFHKLNTDQEFLITLTERNEKHKIIVLHYETFEGKLTAYLGELKPEVSDNTYETIYE